MSRPSNAAIKAQLRHQFPNTTFRVTAGRGTARSWTHINWTDGPSDRLVTERLAAMGAEPGFMDQTDYYNGERISTTRHVSDMHMQRVAQLLCAPHQVPPRDQWERAVNLGFGYYDLRDCVWAATSRRDHFADERNKAQMWLDRRQSQAI